ncbi:hypothetical protein KKC88_04855 [Patescibacteria group bacterium]|nr:hypothetical protein [Patescibacteria group bacterium]MBU1673230.1 hypothetical protein [Patescibacteria group bacterium]MBU1964012.1 hypothetical protein [Patescibacteria group bacterium]
MASLQRTKKDYFLYLNSEFFQDIFLLYLVVILLENLYTGVIFDQININYILVPLILSGAIYVFFSKPEIIKKDTDINIWTWILVCAYAIIGAFIIFAKLIGLGWISYIIALFSGIIIFSMSYLILFEHDETRE